MSILDGWSKKEKSRGMVWSIYLLQFIALFTMGLSFLVSGFLAYYKYDDNIGSLEESHLQWQIKTFWGVLAGLVVGIVLLLFIIGKLVLFLTELWLLYRVLKGSFYFYGGRGVDTDGFF